MADPISIGQKPLHDAITVTADSDVVIPAQKTPGDMGVFQVTISDTATVILQGRSTAVADWVTITSLTATGVERVGLMHQMRASTTVTGGNVSAWLTE